MQAFDKDNSPVTDPTEYEEKKLKELLDKEGVDHVKVTKEYPVLRKGDVLTIGKGKFDVTKVMSGGRYMIKRKP